MSGDPIYYLDTSVFLRGLHDKSPAATAWINGQLAAGSTIVASRLLETETWRTIRDARIANRKTPMDDDVTRWLDEIERIDVTRALLADAGKLNVTIRTSDAVHVATALALLPRSVVVVTHDAQMATAVQVLIPTNPNLTVIDPVTDDVNRAPVA